VEKKKQHGEPLGKISQKAPQGCTQPIAKHLKDKRKDKIRPSGVPIESCKKPVRRRDKHLKTVHKLVPGSPSFIR
jgi:hypothetical protein